MATYLYETKTLDRVKKKFFQRRGLGAEDAVRLRARASSIDSLYTGTKVRDIPEFSLRVVPRANAGTPSAPVSAGASLEAGQQLSIERERGTAWKCSLPHYNRTLSGAHELSP